MSELIRRAPDGATHYHVNAKDEVVDYLRFDGHKLWQLYDRMFKEWVSVNDMHLNQFKDIRFLADARLIQVCETRMRFCDLPIGAKFKYPDCNDVWVVVKPYGKGLVAKWNGLDSDRLRQSMCSFVDEDWSLESYVTVIV